MIQIQYDLFEERTELNILRKEIEAVKRKDDNVRRGLFARYNDMAKTILNLQEEVAELRGALLKLTEKKSKQKDIEPM